MALPDPQEHRRPAAVAAREAMIERLKNQVPAIPAPAPDLQPAPEGDPDDVAPPVAAHEAPAAQPERLLPQPEPKPAPSAAPMVRQTPEALLEALLKVKTPEEVFLMTLQNMPANQVLTTKVGKWNIEIRAISCTVDDTQLNFVADRRKNQCLPDEIGGDYTLEYLSKPYGLKLMGVSFFPSPNSPFVLVSFLRTDEAADPT